MIDEIPIIGVTEWTVDGLAAKEFRRRPKMPLSHRAPSGRRVGDRQLNFLGQPLILDLEPVG
jgi:hypothetical protein